MVINEKSNKRKDKTLICVGWHAYKNGNHLWHVGGSGCYRSSIIISKNKKIAVCGMGNNIGKAKCNVNYIVKMIYGYVSSSADVMYSTR